MDEIKCYHILPCDDDRAHTVNGRGTCWCKPTLVENEGGTPIHRHHSDDGREFVEEQLGEVIADGKGWYYDRVIEQ